MNNDEFAMEDLDDEKTIAYIRERLPQDLKEKFSDDEFYYFLDTIYDYYDKSGILDSTSDEVDIDLEEIAKFIAKEAKKNNIGEYDPEELYFIVEGELAYNGIIDEDEAGIEGIKVVLKDANGNQFDKTSTAITGKDGIY